MTDTIDIERPGDLVSYLRTSAWLESDEQPVVEVLTGGVSNKTVLVRRANGDAWVVKQALSKLRVKVDWFSSPERIHREALGLRWLGEIAPPGTTTRFVFEDFEHHLLGMAAVPEPHENWKTMLLDGRLELDHVQQFGNLLGTVHSASAIRREEILPLFGDRSFFESLRLEPYYVYTASQVPEARTFINSLLADTRGLQDTIVHGDYSPKNVLVHNGNLILLDHEVIHLGDPGFDLGFSLTHLLSKAHHLPEKRTDFAQASVDYWASYSNIVNRQPWTDQLEFRAIRHTLACMLARVRGRSPLEYLTDLERARQANAVVELMKRPPGSIALLSEAFLELIEKSE